MKNSAILRRARNSNVFKVTQMNNVKAFDKHIQKVLTDKNYIRKRNY